MQFLLYRLAVCWESYHKIQDSFQLLFAFNLGLSSPKMTITNCQLLQIQGTEGQIAPGPQRSRGTFPPAFEQVTYGLGGVSSMVSFCSVTTNPFYSTHTSTFPPGHSSDNCNPIRVLIFLQTTTTYKRWSSAPRGG